MYKVYRCVDGIPQKLIAECATLQNACLLTQRLTGADLKPSIEYRILGPSSALPSDNRPPTSSAQEAPRQGWFRADGSAASVHVATNHPGSASPRRHTVATEVKPAVPNRQMTANKQVAAGDEAEGMYYVARYALGRRTVIGHGYENLDDAYEVARSHLRDPERKTRELYVVIEHALNQDIPRDALPRSTKPGKKRHKRSRVGGYSIAWVQPPTHVVVQAGFITIGGAWAAARERLRMNPRSDALFFVERSRVAIPVSDTPYESANVLVVTEDDEPYPWELAEWKGDMSLIARRSEELGLGTPAQFGKGRRSRKGDYIP